MCIYIRIVYTQYVYCVYVCIQYTYNTMCAARQTRGLPRLLRCLGTHRTRRAIGSNNESHRMASIALGAMGVPGSAWPRASRTTRPRTAGEAQASHSFVQPRTASHSLAQLRTASLSLGQAVHLGSAWLSLAQAATACHSLAQPVTACHSLAQLGTPWHSLVQPRTACFSLAQPGAEPGRGGG